MAQAENLSSSTNEGGASGVSEQRNHLWYRGSLSKYVSPKQINQTLLTVILTKALQDNL